MIIKFDPLKTKNGPEALIHHLLNKPEDNEQILLVQGSGNRIREDFRMSNLASCKEAVLHIKLSPEAKYEMSKDNWQRCLEAIGSEFNIDPALATVVRHKKKNRVHQHILFPAFDIANNKKYNVFRYKMRSLKIAKILENEFNHTPTPVGPYAANRLPTLVSDPEASSKSGVSFSNADVQKAKRFGYDMSSLRQQFQQAISVSDNERSFNAALSELGFKIEHKVSNTGRRRLTITSLEHPKFTLDATHATGMKLKQLRLFLEGKNYHVQQRKITTPENSTTNQTNHTFKNSTHRQEHSTVTTRFRTTSQNNRSPSNQKINRRTERILESPTIRRTESSSTDTRMPASDRSATRNDAKTARHNISENFTERAKEILKPISPSNYIMALYGINSGFNRDIQLPKRYIFSVSPENSPLSLPEYAQIMNEHYKKRIYAPKHNVKNFEPIQTPAGFCLEITTKTHQKFRDYGSKIISEESRIKPSTASEIIRSAKARGWNDLKITGNQDFKDELTIQAILQNISTDHELSNKAYNRLVNIQNNFKKQSEPRIKQQPNNSFNM